MTECQIEQRLDKKTGACGKILINNITMKFRENFTKIERDTSKKIERDSRENWLIGWSNGVLRRFQ